MNNSGVVVHACGPNYVGGIGRRVMVQVCPKQKHETPVKITKARMGWWGKVVENFPGVLTALDF
jgi:hypothetical protein